ncbi:MAG: Ribonucleoside-diphosphate reductase subunit beta, partial [Candidatus Beckwithbacteria bacterium GW2011_GWC2_47_9]
MPAERLGEIKSFVRRGLQDFSISRLKEKMPWGIEVPDDPTQVFYVWFDALVNYISAIGWPDDLERFKKWQMDSGGMVQYCGKDNLRQQSAMWQAMLMAANLPPSRQIVIDGVSLENAYNKDMFPKGILGLNADYVNQYVQYVADRRLEELGLTSHFGVTNPAKWMSTATDVFELVNFFEQQNTSYEVDAQGHKGTNPHQQKKPEEG